MPALHRAMIEVGQFVMKLPFVRAAQCSCCHAASGLLRLLRITFTIMRFSITRLASQVDCVCERKAPLVVQNVFVATVSFAVSA